jgi:hypothetical protein
VRSTNNESAVALPVPIISGKPVRFLWGLIREFVEDGGRKSPNSGSQILLHFLKNHFDIDSSALPDPFWKGFLWLGHRFSTRTKNQES